MDRLFFSNIGVGRTFLFNLFKKRVIAQVGSDYSIYIISAVIVGVIKRWRFFKKRPLFKTIH